MRRRLPRLAETWRRLLTLGRGIGTTVRRRPRPRDHADTFCVIPWMHRFTNEQGLAQICCVGEGDGNTLRDESGRPIHLLDGRPEEEILNLPQMKQLRRDMLAGRWNPVCERCRQEERASDSIGGRRGANERFRHLVPELRARTAADGTLHAPRVRSVDLRPGNVCNLTCRMCGPWAARLWIDAYNRVQPPDRILSPDTLDAFRRN